MWGGGHRRGNPSLPGWPVDEKKIRNSSTRILFRNKEVTGRRNSSKNRKWVLLGNWLGCVGGEPKERIHFTVNFSIVKLLTFKLQTYITLIEIKLKL